MRVSVLKKKFYRGTAKKADLEELRMRCPELWPTPGSINGSHPSPPIQPSTSAPAPPPDKPSYTDLPLNGAVAIPDRIATQSALARFLQNHFRERLSITINPQSIDDWRTGARTYEVVKAGQSVVSPPFPGKNASGFFEVAACIGWVEDWLVPSKGLNGDGGGGDYRTEKRNHELWQMKRERDIADGKYKPVEEFMAWIDRVREVFKTAVVSEIEGALLRELNGWVDALPLAEEARGPLKARCQAAAQRTVDGVLKTWQREVAKIGQEASAKQEELL